MPRIGNLILFAAGSPANAGEVNGNFAEIRGAFNASAILSDVAATVAVAHTFNPPAAGAPFILGPNAAGQLVAGLNAERVGGQLPAAFAAAGHAHGWVQITGKPVTAERWPDWTEVSGKPGSFNPTAHAHGWADIGPSAPATATRWPSWGEVTDKPVTFSPTPHAHDERYLLLTGGTIAGPLAVRDPGAVSGIELGRPGGGDSPYLDWHCGAAVLDYDVRVQATNGGGAAGAGILNVICGDLRRNGTSVAQVVASAARPAGVEGTIWVQV